MSQSPPPAPLSLPASNPKKRPSQGSGAASSSQPTKKPRTQHPLRQTSFPASADYDPLVYSGSVAGASAKSEIDDAGSIGGSFTGSGGGSFQGSLGSRARDKAKRRGRKEREGTVASAGAAAGARETAVDGSVAGGSGRAVAGTEDEEEDEDLEDADLVGEDGGAADARAEKENLAVLIEAFTPEQSSRYDMFKRTKLNKATLRRIVNQTLSQSVPPAVITTVSGFTKVFIGEMVEKARTVQSEWADAADNGVIEDREKAEAAAAERDARRAEEQAAREEEKAKTAATAVGNYESSVTTGEAAETGHEEEAKVKMEKGEDGVIKSEQSSHDQNMQSIRPHTPQHEDQLKQEQQSQQRPSSSQSTVPDTPPKPTKRSPLSLPANVHRGPLLPSHLREALRRSKRATEGGNVGFSGLSMNSYGVKGSLTWSVGAGGGRRLFR